MPVRVRTARHPYHRFHHPDTCHAMKTPHFPRQAWIAALPLTLACLVPGAAWSKAQLEECFDAASEFHQVNPLVLRAIAWQESRHNPKAINRNNNGTTDYGIMQINSIHLRELGAYDISAETLMKPCESIFIAAWYLRRMMDRYGNTWDAVGSYHSQTPVHRDRYAKGIVSTLRGWGVLQAAR
ncbi:Soluble lytic murein transglycosylase and related regulatory proteins (some contain LysM/invasin domains) [plant metagenome]|uniref:Soluble lytic murein transglycosylase and related regulatory proteins (Some contain LysM/invasin domains) n=1 Tax=plant metagenome TaxID=1297885 RepID=A0A484RV86_9ZZZZ